jgi:hypothetical protein
MANFNAPYGWLLHDYIVSYQKALRLNLDSDIINKYADLIRKIRDSQRRYML